MRPNNSHQRIAALLRLGMNLKGYVRAARAEADR